MRKVIFTCLFEETDTIRKAPQFNGWDTVLITDRKLNTTAGWEVMKVKPMADKYRQTLHYKLQSHKYLNEYDLVCFIDSHVDLISEPPSSEMFFLPESPRTIFQQAKFLIAKYPSEITAIDRQMTFYSMAKVKMNSFAIRTDFFIRSHCESMNTFFDQWENQVKMFSVHDELPVPYCIKETGVNIPIANSDIGLRFFAVNQNRLLPKTFGKPAPTVHHITPGRADKNLGKAINDIVKVLPDEDWICFRDIDSFPLYHEEFFKQCQDIANEAKFDLVGCITNRIGLERQLYKGVISDNADILYHRQIAMNLFNQHGSDVSPTNQHLGGLMLMFPKNLWISLGGFEEGFIVHPDGKYFDYHFCEKAKKSGAKLGIAQGIYLFHFYRFGSDKPNYSTKHLF